MLAHPVLLSSVLYLFTLFCAPFALTSDFDIPLYNVNRCFIWGEICRFVDKANCFVN